MERTVSIEALDYPKQYRFSQLLEHYVATRVARDGDFRAGDWLRFLDSDYLDTLLPALQQLHSLGTDIHQDLILTCQLLVVHETHAHDNSLLASTRFMTATLERLAYIVKLECDRREGLVFVEQRMSALPHYPLDHHLTRKGRAASTLALPAPRGAQPT